MPRLSLPTVREHLAHGGTSAPRQVLTKPWTRVGGRPPTRRLLGTMGCAVAALLSAVAALGAPTEASATSGHATDTLPRPHYLAAANYFGSGSPFNLWSTNMSGAPQALAQMKNDGFNAVALIVPWGEFEPHLTPPRYDHSALAQLNSVIRDAKRLHMGVLLRLSYEWDTDPADQLPGLARFNDLWRNTAVYRAWLTYIATIHRDVKRFGNVWEAYLSWEDLWQPVFDSQGMTTAAGRVHLAASLGYQSWLASKSHLSLAKVSSDYGTKFTSFSKVPTPLATRPSFRLMYEYQDWALIHHLFGPAAARFPGLTMETRVDVDPIRTGTQVVGSYTHSAQFRLAGTPFTGIYYAPYMGDPSSTKNETVTQTITALQTTLSALSSRTGGRPLFIYEYQFGQNGPAIANDPQLIPSQVPTYLSRSVPLLQRYTVGYALWTYRDYNLSSVFNPSFVLGSQGWKLSGGASVGKASGTGWLHLNSGDQATQHFALSGGANQVSFEAQASSPASVTVQVGGGGQQTVQLQTGEQSYTVNLPASVDATSVTLGATGSVSLTDIQVYGPTTPGNVYSVTGRPEVGAAALRAANQVLTSTGG